MTMIDKKLPAVLLAVILAGALVLGLGAWGEPAFAAENGESYDLTVVPDNYDEVALPGQSITVAASVSDRYGNDVTGQMVPENLQWGIPLGSDIASVQPDQTDPWKAVVTFGTLPEGSDEAYADVQLTCTIAGRTLTSNAYPLTCMNRYYELVADDLDPYMEAGQTASVTARVLLYSVDHPEGQMTKNVAYLWEGYSGDVTEIPIQSVNQSDAAPVKFNVTRKTNDWDIFSLKATWEDADLGTMEDTSYYYFNTLSYDLNEFTVEADPDSTDWITYIKESEKAKGYTPVIQVRQGDRILSEAEYSLKIQRIMGYDEDTGEDILEDAGLPLTVADKDAVDAEGDPVGGTGIFRITAVARKGGKYTGSTEDNPAFVYLCSDHSLNGIGADVEMLDEQGLNQGFLIAEVNTGKTLTPVVKMQDKELIAGTDYELTYQNNETGESLTAFPASYGEYTITVAARGDYYGVATGSLKVGDKNPITVKAKKVKARKGKKTVIKARKAFTVKKAKGPLSYSLISVNGKYNGKNYNRIKVASSGKVTVKKGLKKGTYKAQVWVYAQGDAKYLGGGKLVTLRIKVK